jgi:hypothetical protein
MGTEIREDQRVLEDLALRVTAADPGQLGNRRFEYSGGFCIVAVGEGGCSGAQGGRYLPRRQATVRNEPTQSGKALLQPIGVARCRFGKAGVEISEGEAGPGKVPTCMCGDLGPLILERRCCAVEPPAPEKRRRVGERQHWRRLRDRWPDTVEIDLAGTLGMAAGQLEQRQVPREMAMQLPRLLIFGQPHPDEIGSARRIAQFEETMRALMRCVRISGLPASERSTNRVPTPTSPVSI